MSNSQYACNTCGINLAYLIRSTKTVYSYYQMPLSCQNKPSSCSRLWTMGTTYYAGNNPTSSPLNYLLKMRAVQALFSGGKTHTQEARWSIVEWEGLRVNNYKFYINCHRWRFQQASAALCFREKKKNLPVSFGCTWGAHIVSCTHYVCSNLACLFTE